MKTPEATSFLWYPDSGRGRTRIDWLDSAHTFSFGGFNDPERMQFGPLRVINDDRVSAGAGFPSHPHRDMEIISFVLDGQLAHKDSLGNGDTLEPGDVQYMSAGTGVIHSEFNPSEKGGTHFLQVWMLPDAPGYEPRYEKASNVLGNAMNTWLTLLKPAEAGGVGIGLRQNAYGAFSKLQPDARLDLDPRAGYASFLQVVSGEIVFGGRTLNTGDAVAVHHPDAGLSLAASPSGAQVIRFDVAESAV